MGISDPSDRAPLSGAMHFDWICDEKPGGFERHSVLRREFTFTPELPTHQILNDIYKRLPTGLRQKLRIPHSDLATHATFGTCVHFPETNYAPKMQQTGDDL